jgi:3-oxoacyl-[acyl-carrier protein] reductase
MGEAIARALHLRGANIALLDIDGDEARLAAAAIDPEGKRTLPLAADVRDGHELRRQFLEVASHWGRVDIMVNNAAITIRRSFWEIDADEWDDVMAVNLRGAFFGCQIAGAHMRDNGFGRIINVSSLAAHQGPVVAGAHYAASKAGILVLTKVVARLLAPHGVTANAVAPGPVNTPAMEAMPSAETEQLAASVPVGRMGRPEEVGALVAFLASDDAGYITGASCDINGGLLMR